MDADEYKKLLKKFHKLSDRHILVTEADMSYPDVQKVVNLSDRIRKAGNELVGVMKRIMNSSCVPKSTANCFSCMAPLRTRRNAKHLPNSSTKCRNSTTSHGISAGR